MEAISKDEILRYAWLGREEGYTALEHEVIFRDLCCGCGACEAVCPEDVVEVREFPSLTGKCTNCGYCLMQCPRSYFSSGEAEVKLFGEAAEGLGHIVAKIGVKTKDPRLKDKVQDGGFVTTALKYALEKGVIDGAIVSGLGEEKPWQPEARLVTKVKELEGTSGTRYSNSPNLAALKEARKKGLKDLAVVGLPCQIEAVRKMQHYPIEEVDLAPRIKFTIAIFCSANFMYDGLMERLVQKKYKVPINKIKKMDIKGKNVLVFTDKKRVEIPLREAYSEKREACKVCSDFSGKLADLSAGAVGSPTGYSTVFARTKFAVKLLKDMEKAALFDTIELKEEKPGLEVARKLQQKKEREATEYVRKRIREVVPLPFKNLKF